MGAPKSVVKVNKNGVTYESNVDACNYYLFELTRAALRDVGKYVKRKWKEKYYQTFHKRSGKGPKALFLKVYSSKNTQYPRLELGLPHAHIGKNVEGFYSFFQELGTSRQKRLHLLTSCVEENIATIVEIESKYLSALEDEAAALKLIDETEYEEDGDE